MAGNAGQVALDVGGKHRHAGIGKALGQDLQRHRLAGAGRAGDQAVAVGVFQRQIFALVDGVVRLAAGAKINRVVPEHHRNSPSCRQSGSRAELAVL